MSYFFCHSLLKWFRIVNVFVFICLFNDIVFSQWWIYWVARCFIIYNVLWILKLRVLAFSRVFLTSALRLYRASKPFLLWKRNVLHFTHIISSTTAFILLLRGSFSTSRILACILLVCVRNTEYSLTSIISCIVDVIFYRFINIVDFVVLRVPTFFHCQRRQLRLLLIDIPAFLDSRGLEMKGPGN